MTTSSATVHDNIELALLSLVPSPTPSVGSTAPTRQDIRRQSPTSVATIREMSAVSTPSPTPSVPPPSAPPSGEMRRPTMIGVAPPRIRSSPGFYCLVTKRDRG